MGHQPRTQGLYDPRFEHDACGVAFVATLSGVASHQIVDLGLAALRNLEHRGASGAEPESGDGAGLLVQIPDAFLRDVVDFELPPPGRYAVGLVFLPADDAAEAAAVARIAELAAEEGLTVLGWRDVPTAPALLGATARSAMPRFRQLFVACGGKAGLDLDRVAYGLRRRAEQETPVYFPSLSARTLVYKGMLTTGQLEPFFPDISDRRFTSALAVVHSRFSTNTFPSWPLAHPYRFIAHNGEINTVMGNRNWMRARESQLSTDLIPGDLARLFPICTPGASDSASFDEVLELLHLGGRSLAHSILMMIPEAWENHAEMSAERRAFYEFHSTVMEPWDGPASVVFTDGTQVGAILDRNGLRPGRFWVTEDGLVVLASEAGVLDIDPAKVVRKGRLQPGRMFLVDLAEHRVVEDEEIKSRLAAAAPYDEWLHAGLIRLEDLPEREHVVHTHASVTRRQQTFGYTEEELRVLLAPMARAGAEPIGSMGTDTPIATLSDRPRLIFDYFTQLFAQVTNPPLDAIREELVTSLAGTIGPEHNLLEAAPASCRQVVLPFPVIDNDDLAKLIHINLDGDLPGYGTHVVRGLYRVAGGGEELARRLDEICLEVSTAIAAGARIVVLSDRNSDATRAPIPSLLLTGAVHHHLIREKTRTQVGLVVEAGDVREVHHVALLIGYGAAAVNPYLAMESVEDLGRQGVLPGGVSPADAVGGLIKALGKGVLKVMSKMGVSTVASYTGAQIFEAIGLASDVVHRYFTGTTSRLGGVGLDVIADEVRLRHERAYPPGGVAPAHRRLDIGGEYQWRREGEPHLFDPETVFRLQHSTRSGRYDVFKQYTQRVDEQAQRLMTLRGLIRFADGARPPVPLDEVEPVWSIVRRFSTGAMSYGSISREAHETLAIAMNRLGGRSNTGEGGEDSDRLHDPERRSAVKQVASGRFGVTSEYLTYAHDLQIKMAQGAKPGEGGQLPGAKVYPWIAQTRYSTPGVGLISPPPHHDIYSIEDLAQLIHDLKNANPSARVHVKLVAEVGVGTVAAGVSKAHADVVLISGHDGGTGAAPLTSLKHAGAPWELGLAETQQTLLLNGLRDRIVVQVDGQLKTGRDVVIAALLGAEEYGFATAPLVVSGCVMMRVCHLDTCPVGIATQNPLLRQRFTGRPEFVVTFFEYIAEEVREQLAALGLRSLDEAIGHAELLDTAAAVEHWKAAGLDLSPLLHVPDLPAGAGRHQVVGQDHGLEKALDNQLLVLAEDALASGSPVRAQLPVRNVNRTVGTMLGHEVTKRTHGAGLADGTIDLTLVGSAGQSFGAFLPAGITLRLEGDANDYLAKGLSGGRIVVRPDRAARFAAEANVIAGNVAAYGATGGELFVRGVVGERFCVRNSGATAVVEGVGDHGCEYMTGGTVVVLGPTGRNVAAGMSGGTTYVLDLDPDRVNAGMVDVEPPSLDDLDLVHDLVRRHEEETGSTVAAALLADWQSAAPRFTKIMPRDYRRVLEARAAAERDGRDVLDAIMGRHMADPRGFLTTPRQGAPTRPIAERVRDWQEVYAGGGVGPVLLPVISQQAGRCMDCGIPFCHQGCPLGNLIPEWNDLVWRDDWMAAAERLHATNNFPEFTGRLCPAPCEAACVLGINADPVTIKNVEVSIIDRAFDEGWVTPQPPERLSGRTVAVVGSGPAGLAVAQQLTRAGHTVAVYERADRAGGLLRYGIPEFKMEKRHLDRRLDQMRAEGTIFRTGVDVGSAPTGDQLLRRYDAVVLAVGATAWRDLPIPGADLDGVHQAMEFLPQANRVALGESVPGQLTATGKDVVIIGGGDTGADCLGTVHRQRAASVTQLEILPQPPDLRDVSTPWPTWPLMMRSSAAHEEGGERVYSVSTQRFLGDENGRLRALSLVEVRRGGAGFEPVPGTERELPAQLVLLAMGFVGPERSPLISQLGVELDARGNVARDASFATSVPGVFVAGDAGRGQSLIVWAIAEGRSCAAAVHSWLSGTDRLPSPIAPTDRPLAV